MSFHVALQQQPIPQSPASSSLSSLDGENNETSTRVYFGPIQTPERRLIAAAAATHKRNDLSSMPVRRSPRLSALQNLQSRPSPLRKEEIMAGPTGEQRGLELAPTSTPPAPDEDTSQDDIDPEPISALATKISRAHDNPSPPPEVQPLGEESDDPTIPISTERHHLSGSVVSRTLGSAIADESLPRVQAPSPPTAPHEPFASLDPKHSASLPTNASADLIIFDDDNLSGVPTVTPIDEPFPDLLAPTPSRNHGPFLRRLESTFQSTSSNPRICSTEDEEGPEHGNTSPSKITATHATNPPAMESPVHSSRFSRKDCPPPHSTQSGLVRQDIDPPDTSSSEADTDSSEKTGCDVVTESRHLVRELGSLSPVSEGVLHNLLSTTEAIATTSLDHIPVLASVLPADHLSHDRPPTSEHQSSPKPQNSLVTIQAIQRPPQRSPWRSHIANSGSPSKSGLYSTLHDPNRTPARRIPIEEAIAQGSASPRRDFSSGPSTGIFGRPVFSRYTSEDQPRNLIRRPAGPANHTMPTPSGIAKPTTSTSSEKMRCGSEEPQFSPRRHPGRPFERSASDSDISSPSKTRIPIFPIRTGDDARVPSTIPEEHGVDSPAKSTQSSPSSKSTLRQPSSMAGSRIPRIGVKPYAKPPEKERQQVKGKQSVHRLFMTKRPTSGVVPTKPVRLVRSVNATGSGSSSEELVDSHAVTLGAPSISQTSASSLPQLSPSLKRKRSVEEVSSPQATQPTFTRLVTSVARQKPPSVIPTQPPDSGPVAKKTRIGHVRRVGGDTVVQKHAARSPGTQASVDETAKPRQQLGTRPVSPPLESHVSPPLPPPIPPALYKTPELPTPPDVQIEPALQTDIQPSTIPSELDMGTSNSLSDGLSSSTTRITRSRRNPQPTNDVFGPVRPLQPRRRRTAETEFESTFPSMSALALKALTTTNTVKNQHNLVAVLETEIIRKPGNRPGSPTTKLKTIEEKRKLEQDQGRRERAERRARRSSELREDLSLASDDEEGLPLGPDGKPIRHRRGPGDEEDYESPVRIERPEKRTRVDETGEAEGVRAKSVRWDRGLFTTIYFDDLPLQSQVHDKPQAPTTSARGALADSAKALRLDSLGNLNNATSPLKDLVQENVVIKKYVYDDDAEAAEVDVPKSLPKGKGKKTKG